MIPLDDLKSGMRILGIAHNEAVTLVAVQENGANAVEVIFKYPDGRIASQLLFKANEADLQRVESVYQWTFDADRQLLKLVSEAYRIHLAHLFDPLLAVHTSLIEPLPHQLTAVYGEMLIRQPLRFLLADDPDAGKTIMAGLIAYPGSGTGSGDVLNIRIRVAADRHLL